MSYRIVRTITNPETGVQHIAIYCMAVSLTYAHELLYYFICNAIKTGFEITEVNDYGFTQKIGAEETWTFDIMEYK